MKLSKLLLHIYLALSLTLFPTATAQALKCYTCGYHSVGYCPENFIDADNTHFVQDCGPPVDSEDRIVCIRYFENGFVRRKCSEVEPEKYQYELGLPCTSGDCYCFDSLCNGAKIDEIIKNGKRPVNPYTTTEKPGPPFKCYRCGDDQYRGRKAPPCPDVFTDDPKYIVECPQFRKLRHEDEKEDPKCTIYEDDHCGSDADYDLNITCLNRDCAFAHELLEGYNDCDNEYCNCYTELCNGKELDELIEKGGKPFNPYTTTTSTTKKPRNGTTTKMPDEDEKEANASSNAAKIIIIFPSSYLSFFLILLIYFPSLILQTQKVII